MDVVANERQAIHVNSKPILTLSHGWPRYLIDTLTSEKDTVTIGSRVSSLVINED